MVDLDTLYEAGNEAWSSGLWGQAREAYAIIVENDPSDRLATTRLIECCLTLDSSNEATRVCNDILDRLERAGNPHGALELITALLELPVDHHQALERSVRLHFSLDDPTAGLSALRQISDSFLERGQPNEAIKVLKRAQETFPQCADIGMELGHLYIALGFIEEGTEQFRELGHRALDHNVEDAMEAFRRWDFLKRLTESSSA